jgi:1-acyl-sn-glycerol-3-phosphate acyltransferase
MIFTAGLFTAILFPPAFLSCFLDPSGRWPSFFQRTWMVWLLKANRIHLKVHGMENLRRRAHYIIVSNHASILDIPALLATFSFPVRFIAKRSLAWFPLFGWFLFFARHILIDRASAASTRRGMRKAAALLKKGFSIIVFPEGTRTPDGEVKEFKNGAFLLALQSKVPILPVSISGTFEMLPRKGWCFWPGTIRLTIGNPIFGEGHSVKAADALTARVREIVIQNLSGQKR